MRRARKCAPNPDASRWAAGSRRSIPALWTVEHALRWRPAAASAARHFAACADQPLILLEYRACLFPPSPETPAQRPQHLRQPQSRPSALPSQPSPAQCPAPTQPSPAQAGGAGQARRSRGAGLRAPELRAVCPDNVLQFKLAAWYISDAGRSVLPRAAAAEQ